MKSALPRVELKLVSRNDWESVVKLSVAPDQVEFVAPNVRSLAEAWVRSDGEHYRYSPLSIYSGVMLVGFAMSVADHATSDDHWIGRFMITHRHQRKGFGRAALLKLIERMTAGGGVRLIRLSCNPHNSAAISLYESVGFADTGKMAGNEMIYALEVKE